MNQFFGDVQAPVDGNFDMSIEVIPKGTILKGLIEESKWETYTPEPTNEDPMPAEQVFIKNTWTVLDGEYQNRKVFQKLHVQDMDEGKKRRALQMLAAIDANAGGKIMASGAIPDDMMLSVSICNAPMMFVVDVWSIGGREGNFINAVSRCTDAPVKQPMQQAQPAQQPMSQAQAVNQAVNNVQAQPQQQVPQQQAPVYQESQQPQNMTPQQLQAQDIDF